MKTEIITIRDENDLRPIKKAARMLDEGKLVAFPTETVYGIGCKVASDSIQRLDCVKGRAAEKRYTLHVGDREQMQAYVPAMSLRAQKLVREGLPGPITVVFELDDDTLCRVRKNMDKDTVRLLYPDNTIGIRYPDHPAACAILSEAHCPVVAPSANPAGKDPAVTFEEAVGYFDGILDGIVKSPDDGGRMVDQRPTLRVPDGIIHSPIGVHGYQKSSTVVKIGKTHIQILRQGAVSTDRIRELTTIGILFVCTGNTCRSPMAEAVCRKQFCDILGCSVDELEGFGYIISSAGVAAITGMPASPYAVEVCRQRGISLAEHVSVPLMRRQIDQSDRIFVMSRGHLQSIREFYPQAAEKCFLLDAGADIADPVGQDVGVYRRCFEQIEKAVIQRVSETL